MERRGRNHSGASLRLREPFEASPREAWRALLPAGAVGEDPERRLSSEAEPGLFIEALYPDRLRAVGWPEALRPADRRVTEVVAELDARADPLSEVAARAVRGGADVLWYRVSKPDWAALPRARSVFEASSFEDEVLRAAFRDPGFDKSRFGVAVDPISWALRGGRPWAAGDRTGLAEVVRHASGTAGSGFAPFRPLLVSSAPYHRAGATAAEELGLMLSAGLAYLRELSSVFPKPGDAAAQMRFCLPLDADVLVGIAKLRAARWLWAKALAVLGAPPATMIWARTSLRDATQLGPHLNLVRATSAATAAMIADADWLSVRPYDDVVAGGPSDHGRRCALNLPLMLRHESHLDAVSDPAGGSGCLEQLTEDLARSAWSVMQEVERAGGLLAGLADGSVRRRMEAAAERRRLEMASGARVQVGVNAFAASDVLSSAGPKWYPGDPPTEGGFPAMRDASEVEALRVRATRLPEAARKVRVIDGGGGKAALNAARNALATAGLVAVLPAERAPQALVVGGAPGTGVGDALGAFWRTAGEGVGRVWVTELMPGAPADVGELALGPGANRVAALGALLDVAEVWSSTQASGGVRGSGGVDG